MPTIGINEFVYRDKPLKEGVTLSIDKPVDEVRMMSLADFDFKEPKPVPLDEAFYRERYPGLPENAYFALAMTSAGMKPKQIRSEYKKRNKKLSFSRAQKILVF